ncbi:hypothetical protein WDZ92_35395 [Nostoc sp. NIES-2111]
MERSMFYDFFPIMTLYATGIEVLNEPSPKDREFERLLFFAGSGIVLIIILVSGIEFLIKDRVRRRLNISWSEYFFNKWFERGLTIAYFQKKNAPSPSKNDVKIGGSTVDDLDRTDVPRAGALTSNDLPVLYIKLSNDRVVFKMGSNLGRLRGEHWDEICKRMPAALERIKPPSTEGQMIDLDP